jgi:hypothetical protein
MQIARRDVIIDLTVLGARNFDPDDTRRTRLALTPEGLAACRRATDDLDDPPAAENDRGRQGRFLPRHESPSPKHRFLRPGP